MATIEAQLAGLTDATDRQVHAAAQARAIAERLGAPLYVAEAVETVPASDSPD